MKQAILLIFSFIFCATNLHAQAQRKANRQTTEWRYEIECVSEGAEGTYLIKVFSYSKKPKVAIEQAKKNAVHGIIFQGFSNNKCAPKPALTKNPDLESEKADFFDAFFADGGKYMKYVQESNDGSIDAEDRLKVGKEYKIGVVVSVRVASLRKDLEEAGIIKGLSSGF